MAIKFEIFEVYDVICRIIQLRQKWEKTDHSKFLKWCTQKKFTEFQRKQLRWYDGIRRVIQVYKN